MKVYIWGTGRVAKEYLEMGEIEQGDILGFIETRKSKDTFYDKKVFSPSEAALNNNFDYILVCVYYYGREIYNICKEVNIDTNKVVLIDNWEWADGSPLKKIPKCCKEICDCHISNIETVFPKLYKRYIKECDIRAQRYMITTRNGYDLQELASPMLSDEFSGKEYQTDYFRYRTFELMANEIIKKKVHGNVAELGVFKGIFSKIINKKFPDKKLYLFDTFESFDIEEYKCELKSERCPEEFLDNFKDTFDKFINNIIGMTECIGGLRGDEIKSYMNEHPEVENYVIIDDDSDMCDYQLFNFVQTDTCDGITERDAKLCVDILNGIKILNPIRMNYELRFRWMLMCKCPGIENNIEELLENYESKF